MRVVTTGSDSRNAAMSHQAAWRERTWIIASAAHGADEQALHHLNRVETRMVDDWEDRRATPDIDDAPHQAEQAHGHRNVEALLGVQGTERDREQYQPELHSTQPLLESMEDERPLQLLAHAAGDDDHDEEDAGAQRSVHERAERILLDRAHPWENGAQPQDDGGDDDEDGNDQGQAAQGLGPDRTLAEEHVPRPFAVRPQEETD